MKGVIMGLDQYAYAVMPHKENTNFGWFWEGDERETNVHLIKQWRKHPNLQGFMEALFQMRADLEGYEGRKGGFGEERVFNLQPIRLTWEDLDTLEKAVTGQVLPSTEGFFFGDNADDYYREQDLEFISEARKAMRQDMEVYYDSWW
jgi:hypothetical protein